MFAQCVRVATGKGLPAGAAESDESPSQVTEGLGLDRPPGRVPAVDLAPTRTIGPDRKSVV